MEELLTLLKLPFDILDSATGDKPIGYGFLMILFGSGMVTVIFYMLNFTYKIIKSILQFIGAAWDSFTKIFMRQKVISSIPAEFNTIISELTKLNKNLSKLVKKDLPPKTLREKSLDKLLGVE